MDEKKPKPERNRALEILALQAAVSTGDFKTFENMMAAGTPGGIEEQEAREQRRFVSSSIIRLPKEHTGLEPAHEIFQSLGIRVIDGNSGTKSTDDPLFFNVELPVGWKIVATEHSMWSKLLDDAGHERLSIFFKGSFYDRRASFSVKVR